MYFRPLAVALCVATATLSASAQRLSADASPTHYGLHFTPDLKAATFDGDEIVDVTLAKPTDHIVLNAAEITFQTVTISQRGKTQTGSATTDEKSETATLKFPQPLAAGPAQLHIVFKGILNDKLRGFYLSKGKDRSYATTQFESTDARRAFPSFDEPAYKATFDIALTIDAGDTAISNGSIAKDTPGPEGKHTLTFTTTPKMSTYLVAMAVGDWKCSEGEEDGIPIRICSTPDKVNLTGYALTSAKQILHFYDNYYGIKWPYKKLDVLAVPDFEAGAMENTAAIFYRETLLLIDDQHASIEAHKGVFDVLAHEMAHQWFGDLVTMKWWNDIWLNEGFATWMTYKPHEAVHPEWKGSIAEASETANTLTIDSRKSTRAIRQQANTPEEINALFDGIAYQKAASVLRMVEHYIGPDVFRKGVNQYLSEHAYANATAEDFWGTVTRVSGKPVDKIMASYTEQPGAPLVSLKVSCQGGDRVERSQQRFFADNTLFGSAPAQVWTIPICTSSGSGQTKCELFSVKQDAQKTSSCLTGSYFNADGRGFYRTQYDPGALDAIRVESLKPEEKILLETDQWALSRAGQSDIGNYLNIVGKVSQDHEQLVLEQVFAAIDTVNNQLVDDSDRPLFIAWVSRTFSPLMQNVGFVPQPGELPGQAELRPQLVAVLGLIARDPHVIEQAKAFTQKYLAEPNAADQTLAPAMLAVAARNGDGTLYNQVLATFPKATTPEVFYALGNMLTQFTQPELVKRTILFATTDKVRNQDAPFVFSRELGNVATRDAAWPVLKQNWPAVSAKFTASSGAGVVANSGDFCTAEAKQDVQSFFTEHPVFGAERPLQQALERINGCINFHQIQAENLKRWLQQHQQ